MSFYASIHGEKIPTLLIDEEVLTEAHAILSYIDDSSNRGLLPQGNALEQARAHEWINFRTSTMQIAFGPLFNRH